MEVHYTAQYQNVSGDRVTKDQSKHNSLVALQSSALCISNDIDNDTVEVHSSSLYMCVYIMSVS